jgi:cytidine deaminase
LQGEKNVDIDHFKLLEAARAARENAYAPYSGFRVGAAALGEDGRVYTGVNIENASYGLTVCAERNAVASAVAAGNRRIKAVAISAGEPGATPCGACRQVISELGPDAVVIVDDEPEPKAYAVKDLLPESFAFNGG